MSKEIVIEPSWKKALADEFQKPYFTELIEFVRNEYLSNTVYPAPKNIFRAFDLCPFDSVKVVILGQDPYHGEAQATGLSFAVDAGVRNPPSLQNIYKELESDLGVPLTHIDGNLSRWGEQGVRNPPSLQNIYKELEGDLGTSLTHTDGDLSRWAAQGVLLLNSTLTVRAGVAGSHQGHGWEEFTDAAIQVLSERREHLVFILWGNYARTKGAHIDRSKHLVIESPHPSPFSAHSGFFGSKPFSKTNEYLQSHGESPIDWL